MSRDTSAMTSAWLYNPSFPDTWERRPLYSLARWVNGLAFRDIQFSDVGKPVIKIAEIKGGISNQTKRTTQTFDEAVHVRAGDLLFSWSGQPETSIDVFWWRGEDGWLNQHSFRVTPTEEIDSTFFYYLLRYLKPQFIAIAKNKQTTGLGHVTKGDLQEIVAGFPARSEQRAIAHILGTLDDKIELNRKMSETLEEMARAVFREQVVANSGAGWERLGLTGIARFQNGLALQRFPLANGDGLPAIKIAQLRAGNTEGADVVSANIPEECRVFDGDVIFSWSGTLECHFWAGGRGALNQHLFKVTSDRFPPWFYYLWIQEHLPALRGIAADKATTMGHINRHHLDDSQVSVPDRATLSRLDVLLSPLLARAHLARLESRTLGEVRDTLLPQLISGELRVKDAERFVKEGV